MIKAKKIINLFVFLAVTNILLTIIFVQNAQSWGWGVHRSTAANAFNIVFKDFFETHSSGSKTLIMTMAAGVTDPDRNRGNQNHINISECAWKANKLAKKSEKLIRKNSGWHEIIWCNLNLNPPITIDGKFSI